MTNPGPRLVLGLALLSALAAAVPADRVDFERWEAVQESLSSMPRWRQIRWLRERGLPDPLLRPAAVGSDSGLSVVGRWSYGPARSVDIRATADDTIVFLSRGSGVTVGRVRTADSLSLQLLADINCASLTGRVMAQSNLLSVGSGGVEFYDIRDLARPALLGRLSAAIYDFWVQDTFVYTVGPESLKVYSIADPTRPRLVGASRDSGFVMCVSGNYAYLGHSAGLYVIDITDPAHPSPLTTIGADASAITARDTFLYVGTTGEELRVYGVANPAQPRSLGSLGGIQTTYICLPPTCDTVIYSPWLQVISVADPAHPRLLGTVTCPGWDYWVAVLPTLNYALVADYFEGLVAVDIRNPVAPAVAGQWWAAEAANDVWLEGGLAYVADGYAGMRILDVTDPSQPATLGSIDTLFGGILCPSVAVIDSFAFTSLARPWFRSVSVADPANPYLAGACQISTEAQDMAVRDSFVFAAVNYIFEVVNVARPREPRVVGTVNLPERSYKLVLADTIAYVANLTSLQVLSIARPTAPRIIGTWSNLVVGIAVVDSVLYATGGWGTVDQLYSLDVSNPANPQPLDSVPLENVMFDIAVIDTVAYVGGWAVRAVSVADPWNLRVLSYRWVPPSRYIRRLVQAPPYVYVCATDGGVCIMELAPAGVSEERPGAEVRQAGRVWPSVTRGRVSVGGDRTGRWQMMDVTGRKVVDLRAGENDVSGLGPGVYIVRQCSSGPVVEWSSEKIVITR
jgi:hypothetical protein